MTGLPQNSSRDLAGSTSASSQLAQALRDVLTVFSFDPNVQAGMGRNAETHTGVRRIALMPMAALASSPVEREVKNFVVVDAAMNDLVRPAMYESYHEIVPVHRDSSRRALVTDVVGPICESGDYLAQGRSLPKVDRGDLLAVFTAGAYGFAMSSNYNNRPRAAEVLVDGREHRLIRRRETYADLVAAEL